MARFAAPPPALRAPIVATFSVHGQQVDRAPKGRSGQGSVRMRKQPACANNLAANWRRRRQEDLGLAVPGWWGLPAGASQPLAALPVAAAGPPGSAFVLSGSCGLPHRA